MRVFAILLVLIDEQQVLHEVLRAIEPRRGRDCHFRFDIISDDSSSEHHHRPARSSRLLFRTNRRTDS